MKTTTLSLLSLFLVFNGSAQAYSEAAWREHCVTDCNGNYYVVAKWKADGKTESFTKVILTIAERRSGSPPVQSKRNPATSRSATFDPNIRVRDGDTVLGSVELDRPPGLILVSSTGKGIVTLGHWKDEVVIYSNDGKVVHRKEGEGLFEKEARQNFHYINGVCLWLRDAWLDEKRDEVVVIATRQKGDGYSFATVGFKSGEVRARNQELIDLAIAERNPNCLSDALDLAIKLKLAGSKEHWPGILEDEKLPLKVRLQAALLLADSGDRRGSTLMIKAALDKTAKEDASAQDFAVRYLPRVVGDKAAPVLCDYVRKIDGKGYSAREAMREVSAEAAVPALCEMLDPTESVDSQLFAIGCLGNKGPAAKAAVPNLIRVLDNKPIIRDGGLIKFSTHEYAAFALGRIGPDAKDALPALTRLAKDSAPDEWERVRIWQPESRPDGSHGIKYSDDPYVDAICKIRAKTPKAK